MKRHRVQKANDGKRDCECALFRKAERRKPLSGCQVRFSIRGPKKFCSKECRDYTNNARRGGGNGAGRPVRLPAKVLRKVDSLRPPHLSRGDYLARLVDLATKLEKKGEKKGATFDW